MRWGAGRPSVHGKAEHCLRLDVRRWHREGLLRPGRIGSWQWSDKETGEQRGAIGFRIEDGRVRLDYSIDGEPAGQFVRLSETPCHFGGARPWFICPIRGERVAVLYLRAGRFACRHCQRLVYASQSEDACGRAWRRQAKLEARLGPNWRRPKGMHRKTRERIVQRVIQCETVRDEALYLLAEKLIGRGWL